MIGLYPLFHFALCMAVEIARRFPEDTTGGSYDFEVYKPSSRLVKR